MSSCFERRICGPRQAPVSALGDPSSFARAAEDSLLSAAESKLAERGGFEPPEGFNPFNGLANRCLKPLGHLSKSRGRSKRALPASARLFSRILVSSVRAAISHSPAECSPGCGKGDQRTGDTTNVGERNGVHA